MFADPPSVRLNLSAFFRALQYMKSQILQKLDKFTLELLTCINSAVKQVFKGSNLFNFYDMKEVTSFLVDEKDTVNILRLFLDISVLLPQIKINPSGVQMLDSQIVFLCR